MAMFISLSANHAQIDKILEKAKTLKVTVKDEVSWDNGFKYDDKSSRNIKVMEYSEPMYKFLLEIEPTVEETKRRKVSAKIEMPTAEELLVHGFREPK